jgi:hypothetical protein
MTMKIVPLDACAYRDIPRQLRELADEIDRGDHPDLQFIVAVLAFPHAGTIVRGWGEYTIFEGIGALARAVARPGE